jgi:hypothetical protein
VGEQLAQQHGVMLVEPSRHRLTQLEDLRPQLLLRQIGQHLGVTLTVTQGVEDQP